MYGTFRFIFQIIIGVQRNHLVDDDVNTHTEMNSLHNGIHILGCAAVGILANTLNHNDFHL